MAKLGEFTHETTEIKQPRLPIPETPAAPAEAPAMEPIRWFTAPEREPVLVPAKAAPAQVAPGRLL